MREAFDEIDTDNSGYLDREEVELAFAAMGRLMSAQELTAEFLQMDKDGGGTVSFAEFKQWMSQQEFQPARDLRLARGQIVCVTAEVDEDGDGIIDWIEGYVRGGDGHVGARPGPCPPPPTALA